MIKFQVGYLVQLSVFCTTATVLMTLDLVLISFQILQHFTNEETLQFKTAFFHSVKILGTNRLLNRRSSETLQRGQRHAYKKTLPLTHCSPPPAGPMEGFHTNQMHVQYTLHNHYHFLLKCHMKLTYKIFKRSHKVQIRVNTLGYA